MSQRINCRPIDAQKALCRVGDREVVCHSRKDEGVHHCQKVSGTDWQQCRPVDFYCALNPNKKGEVSPDVTPYKTRMIGGVRFVYYFSYGMMGFDELAFTYKNCKGRKINPMLMTQIKKESMAGVLENHSLGFFGKSKWGGSKVAGATATLLPNPGKKVKGIIMVVPEEIMNCIESVQQVRPVGKSGGNYKYSETYRNVRVVKGPTENDLGEIIPCKTFVGNANQYSISLIETKPALNYLAMIVRMYVDRNELLGNQRQQHKYKIEERRIGLTNDQSQIAFDQNPTQTYDFIKNRDGSFTIGQEIIKIQQ